MFCTVFLVEAVSHVGLSFSSLVSCKFSSPVVGSTLVNSPFFHRLDTIH